MRNASIARPLALVLLFSWGCASPSKDFETPQGPVTGDQFTGFEILGVSHKVTTTLNQSDGIIGTKFGYSEDVTINVPVGTQIVIPTVQGWELAFGKLDPNTAESHAGLPDQQRKWNPADHHLGAARVSVSVKDVNAPTAAGTQTATLTVRIGLSDDNGDDDWFGSVDYSLIFLGPKAAAPTPPIR